MVTIGSDMPVFPPIPTGIGPIDRLSGGGIAQTEIWELFGDPGSGKSTTTAFMIKACQDQGKLPVLVQTEELSKPTEAWRLAGVDESLVINIKPYEYAENIFNILPKLLIDESKKYARSEIGLVVIDSFSALFPARDFKAQEKNGAEAETMMNFAKMSSRFFNSLKGQGLGNGCSMVLVNQQRVGFAGTYAVTVTSGGESIKYYPKFRLQLRKLNSGLLKAADNKTVIGHTVRAKVIKNNLGRGFPEGTESEFAVMYGKGVDERGPILREAIEFGIVFKKSKVTYVVRDILDGQLEDVVELRGNPAVERYLDDNPETVNRLSELLQVCRAWMAENPGVQFEEGKTFLHGVEFDLLKEVAEWTP